MDQHFSSGASTLTLPRSEGLTAKCGEASKLTPIAGVEHELAEMALERDDATERDHGIVKGHQKRSNDRCSSSVTVLHCNDGESSLRANDRKNEWIVQILFVNRTTHLDKITKQGSDPAVVNR